MPELAEVEFMRRRWDAGVGGRVETLDVHERANVFRSCNLPELVRALAGATLNRSERGGKQMMFCFGDSGWLGVHLGMTGELRVERAAFITGRHDHLVLRQHDRSLVFNDPRMFGAITFTAGDVPPKSWRERPPEIIDARFTRTMMEKFLARRGRAPVKAVLLMQECFPGIGNWMADEVLWRAGIHPAMLAGKLRDDERARLFRELRFVCRSALRTIVRGPEDSWGEPPRSWLFHQRWNGGGRCPRTGALLVRETIGGRTTCWSPERQKL